MAKKKISQAEVSQEEAGQALQIAERYRQIATDLHASKDQPEVEATLTTINALSENAQLTLLKELSKLHDTDAADIMTALYAVSPLKNVRKEARRSLIRLEGAKVYPVWEPPIEHVSAITVGATSDVQSVDVDGPHRFWKGQVTDSRFLGQVQLLLSWEHGENFRDILVLGLLLDFTFDGANDAFLRSGSGRSAFERMERHINESADGFPTRNCTLAEARRLILEALAINTKFSTQPRKDFLALRPLIDELVLNVPGLEDDAPLLDEKTEAPISIYGLDPMKVITNFIELCFDGKHSIAYDLLAQDSRLREGLSKDDWVERRKDWLYQAGPKELIPAFIFELEPAKSKLWLPSTLNKAKSPPEKEIEAAWSVELYETPLNHALPEVPEASAVYEEEQRRWYWATYSLIQENNEWRIQSMTDEVTKLQNLSLKELQAKQEEFYKKINELIGQYSPHVHTDDHKEQYETLLTSSSIYSLRSTYYIDAIIKKNPLDPQPYEDAAILMRSYGDYERSITYLSLLMERFPDQRASSLARIGEMQRVLSENFRDDDDEERAEQYEERAEETLTEALSLEDSFDAHISLIEIYMDKSDRIDDAETHLLQARALATEPDDKSHVERHLAEIAEARAQFHAALEHYQSAVDYRPDLASAWQDLGDIQDKLELSAEAETSYKRSIELKPENVIYYSSLANLYMKQNQSEKAIELMEDGLEVNPSSAALHALLSSIYILKHDFREAELYLKKAEKIDPEYELLPQLRMLLAQEKIHVIPITSPVGTSPKRKKRRR